MSLQLDGNEIHQSSFSTSRADEAARSMAGVYNAQMSLTAGPTRPFHYEMSSLGDDNVVLSHLTYVGMCTSRAVAFDDFVIALATRGRHRWAVGGERGVGSVPFLIVPEREMGVEFTDLDLITVSLKPAFVESELLAMIGADRLSFNLDRANQLRRSPAYLASTMRFLDRALRPDPDSFAEPLIRAEATQLLLAGMASTLSIVDVEDARGARSSGVPRAVKRAMSFMDDNADRPITINDAAVAVHMSVRGLQVAFKKHLGASPSDYLRRVRLSGARADLKRFTTQERTVEEIARRWGFAHTARFAATYRQAYGENPSHTLRD